MTHKFIINSVAEVQNQELPVLYKVSFNNGYYYYHKGKKLSESANRLLYDVFRATLKDVKVSDDYVNMVAFCKRFPSVVKVSIEVVMNDTPEKILKKEKALFKQWVKDELCLNRIDKLPYTPEWMKRELFVSRCETCPKSGVINDKKVKFTFCPNCGKSIK